MQLDDEWDESGWVESVARQTLAFWAHNGSAPDRRGYLTCLDGSGRPYDASTQNLVASSRFVVTFAMGTRLFGDEQLREHAVAAFEFLGSAHRDAEYGGYFWSLRNGQPDDERKILYGHAFVLLAAANAVKTELPGADAFLAEVENVLEEHFFVANALAEPNYTSRDWRAFSLSRGQNPNMHLCEALITAYQATGRKDFLGRAAAIATAITRELTKDTPEHVVWETFDASWRALHWEERLPVDPKAMESNFNVCPGHQAEWAKLLGIMYRYVREDWMLDRARSLYDIAWRYGWDETDGGFYTVLQDDLRIPSDPEVLSQIRSRFGGMKSYWSPPEAIGAAAVLESLTGDPSFQVDRRRLWTYCREQMIDEERGGWYKIPAAHRRDNTDPKGDLFDPDYHALGACFETLQSLASDRLRENGDPP
jgi:mannose/cellobiose epimerase-like protein (N-acyl-D-glucosamine 2-epimerase family)